MCFIILKRCHISHTSSSSQWRVCSWAAARSRSNPLCLLHPLSLPGSCSRMKPRSTHFLSLSQILSVSRLSTLAGPRPLGSSTNRRSKIPRSKLSKCKFTHKFSQCKLSQWDWDAQPRLRARAQWRGRTINVSPLKLCFLRSFLYSKCRYKSTKISGTSPTTFWVLTATCRWWIHFQSPAPS